MCSCSRASHIQTEDILTLNNIYWPRSVVKFESQSQPHNLPFTASNPATTVIKLIFHPYTASYPVITNIMARFGMPQLQKYVPYTDFTEAELRPAFWTDPMDDLLCQLHEHAGSKYDIDNFKISFLDQIQNPNRKLSVAKIRDEVAARPDQKLALNACDEIVQFRHNKFDVLFMVLVLARKSGQRVEEVDLFKRFRTQEFEDDLTFSVSTTQGVARHAIWIDSETNIFRDVTCGETTLIGYYVPMDRTFVEKFMKDPENEEEREYAINYAGVRRNLMVASIMVDGSLCKPSVAKHVFRGLKEDLVRTAGIRFCNDDQAAGDDSEEEEEDSSEENSSSEGEDAGGSGRTSAKEPQDPKAKYILGEGVKKIRLS